MVRIPGVLLVIFLSNAETGGISIKRKRVLRLRFASMPRKSDFVENCAVKDWLPGLLSA